MLFFEGRRIILQKRIRKLQQFANDQLPGWIPPTVEWAGNSLGLLGGDMGRYDSQAPAGRSWPSGRSKEWHRDRNPLVDVCSVWTGGERRRGVQWGRCKGCDGGCRAVGGGGGGGQKKVGGGGGARAANNGVASWIFFFVVTERGRIRKREDQREPQTKQCPVPRRPWAAAARGDRPGAEPVGTAPRILSRPPAVG